MSEATTNTPDVLVRLLPGGDTDSEELADLVALLRDDLLELDVAGVDRLTTEEVPTGSKAALAVVGGWLVVNLGRETLLRVAHRVAAWASQNNKTLEMSLGDDTLKVTGIGREQQDRLIGEWLARQTATS